MYFKGCELCFFMLSFVTGISGYVPLIILKLPRSGSSWFVDKLNTIPGVYIRKEILHHDDIHRYSSDRIEEYLISALKVPISTRVFDLNHDFFNNTIDVTRMSKSSESIQVVGFSLNLEHIPGMNFNHILKIFPGLVVIVLTRSNIVKSAVSVCV